SGLFEYRHRHGSHLEAGGGIADLRDIWGRPGGEGVVRAERECWLIGLRDGILAFKGSTLGTLAVRDQQPLGLEEEERGAGERPGAGDVPPPERALAQGEAGRGPLADRPRPGTLRRRDRRGRGSEPLAASHDRRRLRLVELAPRRRGDRQGRGLPGRGEPGGGADRDPDRAG